MDQKLESFIKLAKIFRENGYHLYLVGGSVRDYLLFDSINDVDVVTDAVPDEVINFYQGKLSAPFKSMGALTLYFENQKFDLTTLRKEFDYQDNRHPSKIEFIKDLKTDSLRRDFTLNALYMDDQLKIYDYHSGQKDLENHLLRMIGDPEKRINEDPLRIIRALRFSLDYDLRFDETLENAIRNNISRLNLINIEKVRMDMRKCHATKEEISKLFAYFHITYLLDMIN